MEYRSQPLSHSRHFRRRALLSALFLACAFSVILGRVGYLTLVRGTEYADAANANLQSLRRIDAPRGNIYDRNGRPVALNRLAYSLTYSRYRRSDAEVHATLARLSGLLEEDLLAREDEILETRPTWTRHSLARRLTQSQIVPVLERPDDFEGVRLKDDYRREYPYGPAMALVAGSVGKITAEDVDDYQRPLYLPDDYVGRSGLEKQYEAHLVGKPGRERHKRDARGGLLEAPVIEQAAHPGDDLVLAIDAELQVRALELLGGNSGAAVIMDVRTGDVVVLAAAPTFDPNAPWLAEINGRPVSYLNRAYRGAYPPGSTFKLMTAAGALRHGWDAEHRVVCTGRTYWEDWPRPFYCDVRTGHGPLDLVHAIQVSCNATFYEMGKELGAENLLAEARRFGFGQPTGIDLPGERSGVVAANGVPGGELLNLSIGQGAFTATPLQVAVAYAALANGGRLLQPRVVTEIRGPDGVSSTVVPVREKGNVALSQSARETLTAGLFDAVNTPGGTAVRAKFPIEWQVCGKTGTAENAQGTNDAWFACFLPRHAPEIAVVVLVENTDAHGGDAAAPIARDLIAAWWGDSQELDLTEQ
ncbi:MAG: penicillin-binding protein 2 [Candidatus Sumerlaeota bacterium]|nr:penicillin-binding protein 2 [Candidatus Sumerlaeota bacterium]